MTARLWYQTTFPGIYQDITDRLRLYTVDVTQNAEEGAVALSTIVVDDPAGDYNIEGWHRLYLTEDSATGSNTFISNGYVTDRTIERGPYRTGAGRVWKVSVADSNAVAEWRIMEQPAANRPAETDVARVQWLTTTSQMNRIPDTSMVSTANPVAMDAVDYRGQRAADVLNDCSQASGKNYFTWYSKTGLDTIGLWYDVATSTAWESPIHLTNVVSDVVADPYGLTYFISEDTSLVRDASRVYSGAYVQYDGGVAYEQSVTTGQNFTWRDAIAPSENVKTSAKASARATRYLAEMSTEEDRITTSFRVPSAKVNFLREGMRVQIKATHLPGYSGYVWGRCLKRTIKQDSEEGYLVTVELSVAASAVAASCAGGIYAITPSQHFTPYGSPGTSDAAGLVYYGRGGSPSLSPAPTPNSVSLWGFATYGPPDFAGDCTDSALIFTVIGPGTLVVQTTVGSGANTMHVRCHHGDGVIATIHDDYDFNSGDTITVTVPSDGGLNCAHHIMFADGAGPCGASWGWSGADWTSG